VMYTESMVKEALPYCGCCPDCCDMPCDGAIQQGLCEHQNCDCRKDEDLD